MLRAPGVTLLHGNASPPKKLWSRQETLDMACPRFEFPLPFLSSSSFSFIIQQTRLQDESIDFALAEGMAYRGA